MRGLHDPSSPGTALGTDSITSAAPVLQQPFSSGLTSCIHTVGCPTAIADQVWLVLTLLAPSNFRNPGFYRDPGSLPSISGVGRARPRVDRGRDPQSSSKLTYFFRPHHALLKSRYLIAAFA
eukprot:1481454-Rhodomonas_salina.1